MVAIMIFFLPLLNDFVTDAMDPTSGTDYLYENLSFPQIVIKVRVAQFATTRNRVANYICVPRKSYGIPPICLAFSQRVIIISKLQIRIKF